MEKKTATLQNEAFTVDGFSKSSPILWCSGLRMALFSCCNALPSQLPHSPFSSASKALWCQTRALTEDALILQPLITRVSLQCRADGRTGHRKDVPTINQTPGVTAHKIGELSLGSRCWRHPLCHRVTPPFLLFGSKSNGCPTSHSALPPLCFSPGLRAWTLL